ncbi:hypothetical protein NT6N_08550 [Oceaniferula spumae]|uniref:Dienelactone hydrolase domain-containing protein n=1 Tax=Oceaniferula spumae TaxID=2979115 RepID=A0AAT9FII4_9BACT
MRFLFLLLLPVLCSAKTIELGFPDLAHRVKVQLPDEYDASKKYPALFYYHGGGGNPDTSLMRHHVDGREWIVVGMTYYQQGRLQGTKVELEKELTLFRSVRRHLADKYNMDQKRCYVAGFSKGGYMSDFLLQAVPDLAGGAIMGAGHLYKVNPGNTRKFSRKKPVFIGVGRLDGGYYFSLRAVVFYRNLGASTTFDVWHDIAHSMPKDGSTALQQWLVLQTTSRTKVAPVAQKEMEQEFQSAAKLDPFDRWIKLRQLRGYPYASLAGDAFEKKLASEIETLEKNPAVAPEASILNRHHKILFQEISDSSLENLKKANAAYLELLNQAASSKQAELVKGDYQRTRQMIEQYKKPEPDGDKGDNDPFAPNKPKDPENKRRIPRNPLVK